MGKKALKTIIVLWMITSIMLTHVMVFAGSMISYALNDAGKENVEFSSYFETPEGQKVQTIEKAINSEDIKLCMEIEVKEQGYLNGKIEFKNENFKFKQEQVDGVEIIEDNVLTLKQINGGEKLNLQIGLEVNLATTIDINTFNQDSSVLLTGTYKSATQNERDIEIEQNIKIILTHPYQEGEESYLNTQTITNKIYEIDGQNKRVVQLLIESRLQEDGYPIKQTTLQLEAPKGVEKTEVLDRGTLATNGKNGIEYKVEENNLSIQIENPEKDGKISYVKQQPDTLIVTYVYAEETPLEEGIKVKSSIQLYDQEETNFEKEVISKIEEERDEIIGYSITSEQELYKGNLYAGEEQSYRSISQVDIRYPQIESNISIVEGNAYYRGTTQEGEYEEAANSIYQKTMIDKEELLRVLGEEGELVIKKTDGTLIKKFNYENVAEEEQILIVNYEEEQKEIVIEINHAKNAGIINIMHEKAIAPEYKQRDEIKGLTDLIVEGTLNETKQIQQRKVQAITNLKETQTRAESEISNSQLIAGKTNQNIEIKTTLITNENSYDLYKNPTIEVRFPEKIQEVSINSVNLLYGEGLAVKQEEIYEDEEGKQIVRIEFAGEQARYTTQTKLVQGANVILNCNIAVESLEENESEQIQLQYTNDQEVEYYNGGISELEVNYIVTQEARLQYQNQAIMEEAQEAQIADPIIITKTITVGNGNDIYERQVQKYKINVRNNTNEAIQNIMIEDEIPNELTYVTAIIDDGFYNEYKEDETITKYTPNKIENLEPQEEVELFYYVRVKQDQNNIGKTIGTKATATIEGNGTVYESNLLQNTIKESKFQIDMITRASADESYQRGSGVDYKIVIKNITSQTLKNVVVSSKLPEGTGYLEGCDMLYEEEYEHYYINNTGSRKEAQFSNTTSMVTWEIGDLKAGEEKAVYLMIELQEVNPDAIKIAIQATAKADGTESYQSNIEEVNQAPTASCTLVKETNLTDKYVYEGNEFEYILTVKNIGKVELNASLIDEIPEGLYLEEINYTKGEESYNIISNAVNIPCILSPGETMIARLLVGVGELPSGTKELEIKNKAQIEESTLGVIESNEVTTIIRKDPNRSDDNFNDDIQNDSNNNLYSISGMAWIDENKNGIKDNTEDMLSGIPVVLYDKNGKTVKDSNGNQVTATTGDDGSYILRNVNKGDYIVVFQYDNKNYTLTEYKKIGVQEENNSNVTTAKLGEETVAVTDTVQVSNKNVENINIGLVPSNKFDLRLDKYISSITVQSGTATKKYGYDNASFAKVEIDRKTVNNTNVTIEYKISVTNEGEIPGYAKKIIDYLPDGIQVNLQLNKDWQQEDGQLISTSLAEEMINPGETKVLSLIVSKQITENNLGTVTNTAEIAKDYNENFVGDIDSTPGNKKPEEDDMSTVSVIIGLNTGRVIIYILLILIMVAILGMGIYMIKRKVIKN